MRQAQNLFNSSPEIINQNVPTPRLFVGRDGKTYISDKFGTHRASALAVALLARPVYQATGYREDAGNE